MDIEFRRIVRMDLQERFGLSLFSLPPGRSCHGVPLVRQPTSVEQQRIVVVGHLGGWQMRPGMKYCTPTGGRERQCRFGTVRTDQFDLAAPVVEVAQRMPVGVVTGRAGPLQRVVRSRAYDAPRRSQPVRGFQN